MNQQSIGTINNGLQVQWQAPADSNPGQCLYRGIGFQLESWRTCQWFTSVVITAVAYGTCSLCFHRSKSASCCGEQEALQAVWGGILRQGGPLDIMLHYIYGCDTQQRLKVELAFKERSELVTHLSHYRFPLSYSLLLL